MPAPSPPSSTQSPPVDILPSYASSTQSNGLSLACAHAAENFCSPVQTRSSPAATVPAPSPVAPRNPDTPSVPSAPQSPAFAPPPQTETPRPVRSSAPASSGLLPS